jgi:hypothetical protein
MGEQVVRLKGLSRDEVPDDLKPEAYFDFRAHPFAHEALFRRRDVNSVYGAILAIGDYASGWLRETVQAKRAGSKGLRSIRGSAPHAACQVFGQFEALVEEGAVFQPGRLVGSTKEGVCHTVYVESGASIVGTDLYLDSGDIYVGSGTSLEGGVGVKGPTIIGKKCEIRQGAYLRGNCVLGDGCTLRGELKNVVLMDRANFPHPSYLGDSVCGYMTHFGNQATAANLGIYEGVREPTKRQSIKLRVGGRAYDLGSPKMGVCMGDFSQVGCNAVTDPGTFLKPYTIVYALTRVNKGFYGPREVLKNKPMEHGVVERAPLEPLD